ncbi:MAG: LysR family transcriptional regulator [Salinisphaeraceae bacterium]|jgi:DNA-binding transcriptional LysR family regulator|nr:LysR family transcriptional regulator [Salinisphaeraceae bacterium]
MHVDVIELFCDIASERSISAGARMHGITQSAASQRIMALERELETRLIDRGTRPLRLTAAGELYRQGARDILDRYEHLKQRIARPGPAIQGQVRVAAIYSAGIDLLNSVAQRFEADHPGVRVQVDYLQPSRIVDRVRESRVDFGILSYPQKWRDLVAQPLRQETMVVVCRAGHALASREVLSPADLVDQPIVGFDSSLPVASQIASYLRRNGGNSDLSHSFDNIDTIKAYVGHSHEAAILPHRAVAREVEDGSLAAIRLEPCLSRPVAIVSSPDRPHTAAAQALIEALRADSDASRDEHADAAVTR